MIWESVIQFLLFHNPYTIFNDKIDKTQMKIRKYIIFSTHLQDHKLSLLNARFDLAWKM